MTSKAAIRTALATAASRGRTSTTPTPTPASSAPCSCSRPCCSAPSSVHHSSVASSRPAPSGTPGPKAPAAADGRSPWSSPESQSSRSWPALSVPSWPGTTNHSGKPRVIPRLQPSEFPTTGIAIIGWSLAAYAVAILAGLLWRRVLPALATAVLATFGLAFAASKPRRPRALRLHYSRTRTRHRPLRLPAPARLHPMDQLRARASLLDLPVDRVRLAHSPRPRPHRHHPPAPPTPRRVDLTRTRVALRVPSC